jgi:hypothetical protein
MIKTRNSLLTVVAITFFQFSCGDKSSFWHWFSENEPRLFQFETNQDVIFNELTTRLHRINPDLTFEFGPVEGSKREFVISADGKKRSFAAVEKLFSEAPPLKYFRVMKFRQRRREIIDIKTDDLTVSARDVRYILISEGSKTDVMLFIKGYQGSKREKYLHAAYGVQQDLPAALAAVP